MEQSMVISDPEVFNSQLLDALAGSSEGFNKQASEVSSNAVRRRLRENGFMRNILPMKSISANDLVRLPGTDDSLMTVDEMEPDQPGAVSLPFNDSHRTHYFRGHSFATSFFKITTPEWVKNIQELKVYKKIDLQKVIVDNSLKDIQTHEDERFLGWVDEIIGAPGGANGAAGVQQNFDYSDGGADEPNPSVNSGVPITRESYRKYTLTPLKSRELNNGVFLTNRLTADEFLDFGRNEIGADKAQDLFFEGLSAINQFKIFGIPHIATMKRNLVADGEVYQFAEPDFLGKAYSLKDVTMYVERKKDLIRISAEEIIGVTIANVAAVNKVTFEV